MNHSEHSRKAGVSDLIVNRVEKDNNCRLETKRKIILTLELKFSEGTRFSPKIEDENEANEFWNRKMGGSFCLL